MVHETLQMLSWVWIIVIAGLTPTKLYMENVPNLTQHSQLVPEQLHRLTALMLYLKILQILKILMMKLKRVLPWSLWCLLLERLQMDLQMVVLAREERPEPCADSFLFNKSVLLTNRLWK